MPQQIKGLGFRVENIYARIRSYPNPAILRLTNGGSEIIAQTLWVVLVVLKYFEIFPVEAVQSIKSGKPYKALSVLYDALQPISAGMRQTILHRELLKP